MKRHAVPQNIMDVEFKLFGSLSMRQFGYLAINVIFALFFYATPLPDVLKWPIIVFFVLMGLAMALLSVNGIPFTTWFSNFLLALLTSQRRVWKKSKQTPDILRGSYKPEGKYTTHTLEKAQKEQSEMPLLSDEVISASNKMDKHEEADLLAIDKHFKLNFTQGVKKSKPIESPEEKAAEPKVPPITKTDKHTIASDPASNDGEYVSVESGNSISAAKITSNVTPNRPVKFSKKEEVETTEPKSFEDAVKNADEIEDVEEDPIVEPIKEEKVEVQKAEDNSSILTPINEVSSEPASSDKGAELKSKIEELEKQLLELQKKPSDETMKKQEDISTEIDNASDEIKKLEDEEVVIEEPEQIRLKPSQRPNILSGVVSTKDGTPIEGVNVEIRDDQGFPLRKAETDKLGQFIFSSPIPNGEYILDFNKKGNKFTDYRVSINGRIIPILKFNAE